MRLLETARQVLAILLLGFALSCVAPTPAASNVPTEQEVHEALTKVEADPQLATKQKVKRLRWADDERERSSLPEWLADAFYWFGQSVRVLMWVAIGIVVIALVTIIVRSLRTMERRASVPLADLPTHVRDLDIRPESLPDDIGAAAFALWERGEHRAALALLYRGLLSRLVHAYAVPIKASSTEGDCLELAREHLPTERVPYTKELIGIWQRAVYGARDPDTAQVRALCDGFERELAMPTPATVTA